MVKVLLIRITKNKNITGVVYGLTETKALAFADDTTLFMTRTSKNLRKSSKYIQNFHTISGLACNLDKTHIIPVGQIDNPNEILCPDLGMTWSSSFPILSFNIDNPLKLLHKNFGKIHDKIKTIVRNWTPYKLSLRGRPTIVKTCLVSKLTYVSTVLSPTEKKLEDIQTTINNFIQYIQINKKNWINTHQMHAPTNQGGMGMIKLEDFTQAIKVSWIRRYTIQKVVDHWADIIDKEFGINKEDREQVLEYGPEKFNEILKKKIPAISNLIQSYKLFKQHFPNTIESNENSRLHQQVFYNLNFTRKQPRKKQPTHLTPTFYGLPDTFHTLKVEDFYQNLAFKTADQIEDMTGIKMIIINYNNLKAHITQYIGNSKKYEAVVKEKLPQKEHTSINTTDVIRKAVKGSGTIRKIISRRHPRADIHNPKRWRKKLDRPEVTRLQIKENITRLHSTYLDSHLTDHLSRLRLGKTHLNAQLHHSNQRDNPYCEICKSTLNQEIQEDYKHAAKTPKILSKQQPPPFSLEPPTPTTSTYLTSYSKIKPTNMTTMQAQKARTL